MVESAPEHRRLRGCLLLVAAVIAVACSSEQQGATPAVGGAGSGQAGHSHSSGSSSGGDATGAQAGESSMNPSGGSEAGAANGGREGQAGGATLGGNGGTGSGGTGSGGAGSGVAGSGSYWKPSAGTSWQWQLTGSIDQTVEASVFDIDGFDTEESVVKALHARGRKVICYLSVGSYEDWRADAKTFPSAVLGNEYPGWPGERFVDIRAQALRDIIASRFDLCRQKGFDGIEPDNMDVYDANSGFPLTEQDGIDYANWLAREAHARGLNIGQKNAPALAEKLEPNFDWVLTEDCFDQGWCADVSSYVDHQKPVFMSEYTDTGVDFGAACRWGKPKKYSPILKGRDLDAAVQFCP